MSPHLDRNSLASHLSLGLLCDVIEGTSAETCTFCTGGDGGKIDSEPEVLPDEEELDSEGT
jgi:hypothetical protein